jgi:hypothetical protein
VRFLGTFLEDPVAVPVIVLHFLAAQINVADLTCVAAYRQSEQRWRHTTEIRTRYGYREVIDSGVQFRLGRWLSKQFIESTLLLNADIAHEQTPQARFHSRTNLGNKSLQNTDASQKYLLGGYAMSGERTDRPLTLIFNPHSGSTEAKVNGPLCESRLPPPFALQPVCYWPPC